MGLSKRDTTSFDDGSHILCTCIFPDLDLGYSPLTCSKECASMFVHGVF